MKYRIIIPGTNYTLKFVDSSGEAGLYKQLGYCIEKYCDLCSKYFPAYVGWKDVHKHNSQ